MANQDDVLAPGARLNEFTVEEAVGAGGFGVTYLAWDLALERRVAVKEYLPYEWGSRRADGGVGPRSVVHAKDYGWGLARFLEEARALARFDHPHLVRVYQVFEAGGTAYLVMEYVEGPEGRAWSLADELASRGSLSEARVRALMEALSSGLSEVHAKGLTHRDVKPANVMLRSDGSPVLIDFGAARQAVGRLSHQITSVLSEGYAPIEQYGAKRRQGPWTDVYALGAVAYEALSGRVPDHAPDRVRDDPLPPLSAVAAGRVSGAFASAVDSALSLHAEDRPQSVSSWLAMWSVASSVSGGAGSRKVDEGAAARWRDDVRPQGGGGGAAALPRRDEAPAWWSSRWAAYGLTAGVVSLVVAGWLMAGGGLRDAGVSDGEAERPRQAEELGPPGRVFRDCAECPEMVVVPAGEFMMGSPSSEQGRYDDEGPRHRVTILSTFAVGVYEVTFSEWDACVAGGAAGAIGRMMRVGDVAPVLW